MPDADEIRSAVEQRFAQVARSPDQEKKFPVGPDSAKRLGYDPQEIDALPLSVTESFCGVGNPLGLGEIRPAEAVLDLGSGASLDSLLAAFRVGPTGKVVGVDLCPEMVEKARHNADRSMSRHQALKQWRGRELIDQLAREGILIRSPSYRGVAEEAPAAYKDVSAVVDAADAAGLSRKVARLKPMACIKG